MKLTCEEIKMTDAQEFLLDNHCDNLILNKRWKKTEGFTYASDVMEKYLLHIQLSSSGSSGVSQKNNKFNVFKKISHDFDTHEDAEEFIKTMKAGFTHKNSVLVILKG